MNIFQRAITWLQKRGVLQNPDSWLVRHFFRPVRSGVSVTELSAMRATAVFACVRLISGTIASLPLPVYRRLTPRGKERVPDEPSYYLLHTRPNPEISSYVWRQLSVAHLLLWGNAYSEIEYLNGEPVAFWPIPPWKVRPKRTKRGHKWYEITNDAGQATTLPAWKILHFPNVTLNGMTGMSCIRAGAEAIGLSLAAEEFGARFFGEGANMGGVVEHPGKLSPQAHEGLKKDINEKYTGLGRAHRIMLLEEGMKYQRVGIPPNEAQFLETRKFQVAEIGRLFGISQLHKIGDLERATFSNIEEQNIDFVVDTIRPLIVNMEQEINYKLYAKKPFFAEFVIDGLLRGNITNRYQSYATARQWGWMNADDIRELENMNPLPDGQGQIYLVPMNMIPADQAALPILKEPTAKQDDDRIGKKSPEKRHDNRMALLRARTAKSYEQIFLDAAQKVMTREKTHVLKALEKHLGDRSLSSFDDWLEDFYREFKPFVAQTMKPAIIALAEAIRAIAAQEIGMEEKEAEVQRAIDGYIENQADRHVIRSKATIRQLIARAEEENLDTEELITERMETWEKERPKQIASDSSVAVASRIAKAVFIAGGIQYLRWVAIGSNTCPYCQELDGRTVGITQPFVAKDGALDSEDGTMNIHKPALEPPLHKGCVCTISPA